MAFSGDVKLISQLTEATSVSDTDNLIIGDSDAKKITWENLSKAIFLAAYPVGSIYISIDSTNPRTLYGGNWSVWGSGRVPVGVNTSDSDFSTANTTGGSKSNTYSFNHNHAVGSSITTTAQESGSGVISTTNYTGNSSGGSTALNTMEISTVQPYVTCHMWRRVS